MKLPNDTVPDPVQRNGVNDTDPSSAPVHHETPPQVDTLLGGIGARAPKAPQMAAESAGREAAQYQAVASPARTNVVTIEDVPAVIVRNNTQPLPRLAPPPVAEPAKVVPKAAAPARQLDTTVPGARQVRGRRDRATWMLVAGLLLVSLVVVLLWRPWRGPSLESAGSQPTATTGPAPSVASTPTILTTAVGTAGAAIPTAEPAPAPAPSATPSARPSAAKSAPPPRATDTPRPTPSSAPTHEPRPIPTPSPTPPAASTDHVRSI